MIDVRGAHTHTHQPCMAPLTTPDPSLPPSPLSYQVSASHTAIGLVRHRTASLLLLHRRRRNIQAAWSTWLLTVQTCRKERYKEALFREREQHALALEERQAQMECAVTDAQV